MSNAMPEPTMAWPACQPTPDGRPGTPGARPIGRLKGRPGGWIRPCTVGLEEEDGDAVERQGAQRRWYQGATAAAERRRGRGCSQTRAATSRFYAHSKTAPLRAGHSPGEGEGRVLLSLDDGRCANRTARAWRHRSAEKAKRRRDRQDPSRPLPSMAWHGMAWHGSLLFELLAAGVTHFPPTRAGR